MRRVVVTGLGVISPAGIGKEALWEMVTAEKSMTKSLSSVTSSDLFGRFDFPLASVAEVPGFDERAQSLPEEVQRLDRFVQFAVASAWDAMVDAGLRPGQVDPERFGISLSTAICGTPRMEKEFLQVTNHGKDPIDPSKAGRDLYLAAMSNTPGAILAPLLGAQGQCVTLSTGCIGGIDAIDNAYEAIRYGDAEVMIAGASEAPITPITVSSLGIIDSASRSYDGQRDRFVLGEGCGIVILEELEHALRRGSTPYMEICGFSQTYNAVQMTDLPADGADPALGERHHTIPVDSVRSMLGHALSAAGAIEFVLCALVCARGCAQGVTILKNAGGFAALDAAMVIQVAPNEIVS